MYPMTDRDTAVELPICWLGGLEIGTCPSSIEMVEFLREPMKEMCCLNSDSGLQEAGGLLDRQQCEWSSKVEIGGSREANRSSGTTGSETSGGPWPECAAEGRTLTAALGPETGNRRLIEHPRRTRSP